MKKNILIIFISVFLVFNCIITKKTNHIERNKMEEISGNQPFILIKIKNNDNTVTNEFILIMSNIYENIIDKININEMDISCFLNEKIILAEDHGLLISTINDKFDIYNIDQKQLNKINNIITQNSFIKNTYDIQNSTAYLILNFSNSILKNKNEINKINDKIIKIIQKENPDEKYKIYIFNTEITNKTTYERINQKYISFNIILDTDKNKGIIQPEVINIIHTIKNECSQIEGVIFTSSISDSIININNSLNNENNKILPDNIQLIQQILLLLEMANGNTHNLINFDYSRTEIQIIVDNMSNRQYLKILTKIDKIIENYRPYFKKIYIYREDI